MLKNRFKLTLKQKRTYSGYLWISPFIIGFIFFFLRPIVQSLIFSLNELEITFDGFDLHFVGLENFKYALLVDANFLRVFVETVLGIIADIPAIIIFSFFIANLLNQKIKGRFLFRAIFFLPVILMAGVATEIMEQDFTHQTLQYGGEFGLFGVRRVAAFLREFRLPEEFLEYIIFIVNRIPAIINYSAVPILIFLAGLQAIPSSLYECAKIEGATSWESFWKITFPLISPLFLTNIVFIIIFSFTAPGNELVDLISNLAWGRRIYGVSIAMSWLYFITIGIILWVVIKLTSKYIVFME